MKKTIYITITFILFTTAFCVSASAEAGKGAFAPDERFLAAWTAEIEITDETVVDEKLEEYDFLNLPAIPYGYFFEPAEIANELELNYTAVENYYRILWCEETGEALIVYREANDNGDSLSLEWKCNTDEYCPLWLKVALGGYNANDKIPADEDICKIIVSDNLLAPFHLNNEAAVFFETENEDYITFADENMIYVSKKADELTDPDFVVTFSRPELIEFLPEYESHFSKWSETREIVIGSACFPSYFAAYFHGFPPELPTTPYAWYAVMALLFIALVSIAVVINVKAAKRRGDTAKEKSVPEDTATE